MNGNHVRSKLKIRNRILAIAVAFLLLSLMIPHAVFATESTDANSNDVAKEVNNEAADNAAAANEGEPAANDAVTVTGTVTDGISPVSGAIVYAYQGVTKMGSSNNTGPDGSFTLPLDESVQLGDKVMLKVVCAGNDYGFEVLDFTVAESAGEIALKAASPTTIKPFTGQDERHSTYKIEASIDGVLQSSEIYDNDKTFAYNLPAGGQLTMTDRAHLYYNYTNTRNQEVSLHIIANGADLYKAFWWGIQSSDSELEDEMVVNQPYTLTASVSYTVAVWYQGLAMLDFSSTSDHHDYFDINYVKNGAPYVNLQQASFKNTTFDGATCKLCDDGRIEIFFDSTDEFNTYNVVGYITPVAKAGYKLANWTYNGETLKAGEEILATQGLNMAFVANYEVDASKAPATGDFNFIWVIALSGLALASAAGALRFRKNR